MTLRTLMQLGPVKANELFTRLLETSDTAVKTRERLFSELKAELELHTDLEEQHLFPILKKHPETKELAVQAIKDNRELRAKLGELESVPKNHETFAEKLSELQKTFRQHARDDKKELIPAVQRALSEEQVQEIAEKIEAGLAEADHAKHEGAEERRANARREREQAEQQEAEERRANATREREQAEQQAEKEEVPQQMRNTVERVTKEAVDQTAATLEQTAETARQVTRNVTESAQRVAAAPLTTGLFFWDWMLGLPERQQERSVSRSSNEQSATRAGNGSFTGEEVIPLAEETLVVGKRTVTSGTTRIRRYVVDRQVEQQVSLYDEKVVVERRRPVTDAATGDTLTELSIEVVETSEVPFAAKDVRVREEIVVRKERTKRIATVRETVRRDEVQIEQPTKKLASRQYAQT
jgi:uncharacterized protein (TIGR02271 family)